VVRDGIVIVEGGGIVIAVNGGCVVIVDGAGTVIVDDGGIVIVDVWFVICGVAAAVQFLSIDMILFGELCISVIT